MRTRDWVAFGIVAAVATALAVDIARFTHDFLPPLPHPDSLAKVDVIVALTGGQKRIKEAFGFLEQGKGRYLFLSGIEPRVRLDDILEVNNLENFPAALRAQVQLGDVSRSTVENAQEVRHIAERLNARSILLVTSNYHMRRSLELFREEFARPPVLNVEIENYPVESPNFPRDGWQESPTAWRILLSEYLKTWPLRLGFSG